MSRKFNKPEIVETEIKLEGVYANSGAPMGKCRFGRDTYNPGSDKCQACSLSGGLSYKGQAFKENFTGCVDGMPGK